MKQFRTETLRWPLLTVLFALLCALLRRRQLNTAFEGDLQLPIPMAPATIALVVVLILAAVVMFLLARRQQMTRSLRKNPELAVHAHENPVFLCAVVAAAFLTLIAAPLLFKEGGRMWATFQTAKALGGRAPAMNNGLLILITAVTSALSFIGLLVVGKAAYRSTAKGRLAILLPAVNGCLWLMEIYRGHAANPVLWDYAPLLIAIVCGILFYLEWSGLHAGPGAPRRTLWLASMTVIFSALTLAGGEWNLSSALLLAAQIILALAVLWLAPNNLRNPPELPVPEAAQDEEKLEEDTHE